MYETCRIWPSDVHKLKEEIHKLEIGNKMGAVKREGMKRNLAVPVSNVGEHQNWQIIKKGLWLS